MKNNILFLMTDQFAYHAMGCRGSCAQTPNLDAVAECSLLFTDCYTSSPLCLPARASLATGLYPEELDLIDNFGAGLTTRSQTWMQLIRDNGYETSLFGKAHLHPFCPDLRDKVEQTRSYGYQYVDELPGPRTYATKKSSYYDHLQEKGLLDIYRADMKARYVDGPVYSAAPTPLPLEDYADVYIADRAIDYLSSVPEDRAWFCTVSFGGPHDPWDTPMQYTEKYRDIPVPEPLKPPVSVNRERPHGVYDEILNGKYDPNLTEDILRMTPEDVAAIRRSYYGHVTLIDDQIGRIFDCLRSRNLLEHTIVVFTSDHGEENGDYGLIFKQTFFKSSVRVPLMISVPEGTHREIHQPVELMDVGATLCELAGVSERRGHSRSLLPLVNGKSAEKECIISQVFGETMLLWQGKKAVFNRDGDIYLLFDLEKDPEETRNLAAVPEYAALETQLKELREKWEAKLSKEEGVPQ